MKVIHAALGFALVQALAAVQQASASGLLVQFNEDLLAREHAGNASVSFLSDSADRPSSLASRSFAAEDNVYPFGMQLVASAPATTVPCADTATLTAPGSAQVLVLISSCFPAESQTVIETWITGIKSQGLRYFDGDSARSIDFVTKYITGNGNSGCSLPPGKVGFTKSSEPSHLGVIAFIKKGGEQGDVISYKESKNVNNFLGFAEFSTPAAHPQFNDFAVTSISNLNPFTIARSIYCKDMAGGVATSYVDTSGVRKCLCSCPRGYRYKSTTKECVPNPDEGCKCAWNKDGVDFKIQVTADNEVEFKKEGTCLIKNVASPSVSGTTTVAVLPVPVAVDNYVDHYRINSDDSANIPSTARIELQNTKKQVNVKKTGTNTEALDETDEMGTTKTFTWRDYQNDGTSKINALEFTKVGKYSVELKAWDYGTNHPTCAACLVVQDTRRPTPNSNYPCPTSIGAVTDKLSAEFVTSVQANVNKVAAFKENALNDPCGTNEKCDADTLVLKTFVADVDGISASSHSGVSEFFEGTAVSADLKAKLLPSPFYSAGTAGLASTVKDVCTRCATLSTQLKEWWTEYKCAEGDATAYCDGLSTSTCNIKQCISVNGKTLASASATLLPDVKTASQTVAAGIVFTTSYDADKTVHVALECSDFPPTVLTPLLAEEDNELITPNVCSYSKKLKDLIQVTTTPAVITAPLLTDDEVKSAVSWRYKIGSGAWKVWGDDALEETFSESSTTITLQAWTQCGKVEETTFKVLLHLNNKIAVCDHFNNMWYQTTVAPVLSSTMAFCLFPKSDFAEITFDYHPNIGLNYDPDRFQMTISKVQCKISYDNTNYVQIVDVGSTAASYQIVKQFAVDAIDTPTTAAQTNVHVSCEFTYKRTVDGSTVGQRCPASFVIKDCDSPLIGKPCALDGKCDFNKCAKNGVAKQDMYQACGGNRVTQDAVTGNPVVPQGESECCPSCTEDSTYTTSCVPIEVVPTDTAFDYIKRCEALKPDGTSVALMLAAAVENSVEEMREEHGFATTGATALMGVSALVALVALVVMQRRRLAVSKEIMLDDDAYYPLMN